MSRIVIGQLFNFKRMSPQQAVTMVFVASIVLVVVSYGIWQLGRIISPEQRFSDDPLVRLSVTNYDSNLASLPNSLTDITSPFFEASQTRPTELFFGVDGKLDMARLEIKVDYR